MHIRIWCSSIGCNTILLYIVNHITQSNPSNRTDGIVHMANVDVFCSIHQCQLSKWRVCNIDPGFFFCWVDEKWGYLVEIWPSNSDCAVANQIIKDDKFRAEIRDLSWYIYIYMYLYIIYPFVSGTIYDCSSSGPSWFGVYLLDIRTNSVWSHSEINKDMGMTTWDGMPMGTNLTLSNSTAASAPHSQDPAT